MHCQEFRTIVRFCVKKILSGNFQYDWYNSSGIGIRFPNGTIDFTSGLLYNTITGCAP